MTARRQILRLLSVLTLPLVYAMLFAASPHAASANATIALTAPAKFAAIELFERVVQSDATIANADNGDKDVGALPHPDRLFGFSTLRAASPAAFWISRRLSEIRVGATRAPPAL